MSRQGGGNFLAFVRGNKKLIGAAVVGLALAATYKIGEGNPDPQGGSGQHGSATSDQEGQAQLREHECRLALQQKGADYILNVTVGDGFGPNSQVEYRAKYHANVTHGLGQHYSATQTVGLGEAPTILGVDDGQPLSAVSGKIDGHACIAAAPPVSAT